MYLYSDKSKLRSRCRYLVVGTEGVWISISKLAGNQLRVTSYRVKRTECYKVIAKSGHDLPVSYQYDEVTPAYNPAPTEAPPDVPAER